MSAYSQALNIGLRTLQRALRACLPEIFALALAAGSTQAQSDDAATQTRKPVSAETTTSGLRHSDTPLSPRSRPSSRNWREPFERFHSNRILWTYDGPAIIADIKDGGIPVQCAVDFWVPESHPRKEEMVCTNRHGEYGGSRNDAKQLRGVLRRPDINSNAWREYQLGRVQGLVDAGCRSFQQDNPWLNYQLVSTGGCYSVDSVTKFRDYLRRSLSGAQLAELGITNVDAFDYRATRPATLERHFREFQKESTRQYHDWLHSEAKRYAQARHPGQVITFSGNLGPRQLRDAASSWLFPYFDFLVSEAHGNRNNMVPLLRDLSKWAREVSPTGGVTFPTNDVWLNQRAIATAYAFGLVPIVPWDVYVAPQTPRYFGDPSDYAPLFRMVRANPTIFDGYKSSQDWFGMESPVGASQGYVRNVERTSDGSVLVEMEGIQVSGLPSGAALSIGGKKLRTSSSSRPGAIRLDAGTAVAIVEPVSIADASVQYLVSIRENARDPKKKVVHAVNWGDAPGRFLVLKRSLFVSVPALAVTPDASAPAPIRPRVVGDFIVYSLSDALWTVLH